MGLVALAVPRDQSDSLSGGGAWRRSRVAFQSAGFKVAHPDIFLVTFTLAWGAQAATTSQLTARLRIHS
jgi:hypothetical protein